MKTLSGRNEEQLVRDVFRGHLRCTRFAKSCFQRIVFLLDVCDPLHVLHFVFLRSLLDSCDLAHGIV